MAIDDLVIEDKRFKQPPAFEIVKDQIVQRQLLDKAQQSAVSLRSKSKIEIVDAEMKAGIDERNKAMEAKPAEAKPAEAKPADPAKPTDAKPADAKPAEAKPEEKK